MSTDTRLSDRIILITGSSSGLGRATALRFARSSAHTIICADLSPSPPASSPSPLPTPELISTLYPTTRATFIQCDVTSESSIQSLVEKAVAFGGKDRLDILCNFAGIALDAKYEEGIRAHELPTEEFDGQMGVNARGTWLCCKYVLRQMLGQEPREENERGDRTRGWILNVGSIAEDNEFQGTVGCVFTPGYTPSKFAVVGMTKQMALDYALDRIHVNCVCPAFVDTPLIETFMKNPELKERTLAAHPWNALGRPEDIADAALYLCSDESAWVTGHALVVDGGYTAK